MASESRLETPCWFVLNHIRIAFQDTARKAIERFNACQDSSLELFAPTYVVKEKKNGKIKIRTVNLTFHYVFVKGTLSDVKMLCSQNNGFSFLIDHGNQEQRYATIPDRDMVNFKNIARVYKNCLPYFSLNEIDLEEGDLVEVINGDFPGLIGNYMPKAKSKSGNIILNIYNNVGTIVFNVKATDVRVLEFSHKSTRANDQIDAFVPNLLKALRLYHDNKELPATLVAKLSVFCSRMEAVKINNRKLDAKLQALLFAGNHILGNMDASEYAKEKYEKQKDSITNEWTRGLVNLLISVINNDAKQLSDSHSKIEILQATSKAQHLLVKEYVYYKS